MTQVTEAVYAGGVLKPDVPLNLPDQQRVRVIVEPLQGRGQTNRAAALDRLRSGIQQMDFRSRGPLPRRDELHDRF